MTRLGGRCPHDDSVSSSSRCHGSASCSPPLTRRGAPSVFVDFFFGFFLGLVTSGLVGFPLPCFFLPLVSWFWVVGLGILLSLASCFFLSLASRATWSSDPQHPRPSQPLVLARPASPISCWELTVGRAEAKGCGVTGGGCDPAHCLGIMITIVVVFVKWGTAPPRTNPGLFASARVGLGGLFYFCLQPYNLGLG